ncbi:unnamed protein product [Bursaphelenchus xylophilus]|uniref:DnaJ homolog subfamily B member 9 n=1 Tax=Bursaphelenchus xylophilus TaxID=6326 RepID=A0A1I7RTD3_BURXY|nr:unnamed protein product [Bursaphelenchus xylophilus]CAG9122494.1 unnamed protein product [Bursaphelenchus xylophilus]
MWRSLDLARRRFLATRIRHFSSAKKDYYEILGVSRTATDREIKSAFYRLSKQYHPDVPGSDSEKFLEVKEAYDVLRDTNKRRDYDNFGHAGANPYAHGFGQGQEHQNPFRSEGYQRVYRRNVNPQEFDQMMRDMERMFRQFGGRNASNMNSQSSRFYGFRREFDQKEFDRIWEEIQKNTASRGGSIFEDAFRRARERSDAFYRQQNDERWQNNSNDRKDKEHWNFYQFRVENYIDTKKWLRLLQGLSVGTVLLIFAAFLWKQDYDATKPRKVYHDQEGDLYNRQSIKKMMETPPIKPLDQEVHQEEQNQPFGFPQTYKSEFR